jgi:thiamine-phosphate pyrophosphorylase
LNTGGNHSARDDSGLAAALGGFYAVLDRDDPGLAEALLDSAQVLQVRLKPATSREIFGVARWARVMTRRRGALLVVNDRIDIAMAVGADAVHLGQDDLPVLAARQLCFRGGVRMVIGVSTHDDSQVRAALAQGADYLGFGPVFPTRTKQNPDPVQGIQGLTSAVTLAGSVPVVAIGGVSTETVGEIARTGATAACAISAINDATDPRAAARAFTEAWAQNLPRPE